MYRVFGGVIALASSTCYPMPHRFGRMRRSMAYVARDLAGFVHRLDGGVLYVMGDLRHIGLGQGTEHHQEYG